MPVAKRNIRALLSQLTTGFKVIFNNAFTGAAPVWQNIAEKVSSNAKIETYTWLGQIPGMREWIDERHVKKLERDAYQIKNRKFESTVSVEREDVEDDNIGTYAMAIKGMADAAAQHPDELVFEALKTGFDNPCYDGQNFFDIDHPVMIDGEEVSVSNMQAGAGPAWFLLATNKPVMPIIYQERVKPELIVHDDPEKSDTVFMKDAFIYGTRSRGAAGYSYWQLAFGSKADLTPENFQAARTAMAKLVGDQGRFPKNIRIETLYTGQMDKKQVSLNAVTWHQTIPIGEPCSIAGPEDETAITPEGTTLTINPPEPEAGV